jgi:hypothetical protein
MTFATEAAMARTGTQENKDANKEYSAIEKDQVKRANKATDWYNEGVSTLASGGAIAADPYQDESYLRNQNLLASTALGANRDAAQSELEATTNRTGMNSASLAYAKKGIARSLGRLGVEYTAGRNAEDYDRYLEYQKFLLGARLAPAGVNTDLFKGAVSGRGGSLKNLADLGAASYGPLNAGIQAAGTAVGGYFAGKKNG